MIAAIYTLHSLLTIAQIGGFFVVGMAIIDSARVENEFIRLTGTNGSRFIPVIGESVKDQKRISQEKRNWE